MNAVWVSHLLLQLKMRLKVLSAAALLLVATCGWIAHAQDSQVASPESQPVSPDLTIPRLSRAPALEDFLSMKPQGEVALQMAKVTGFTQRNPHDGENVSERTEAYLGYDQKNLYVVFVCFDNPGPFRRAGWPGLGLRQSMSPRAIQ